MRQSGHLEKEDLLDKSAFQKRLAKAIKELNVNQARQEVEPFVKDPEVLAIWSQEFLHDVGSLIQLV